MSRGRGRRFEDQVVERLHLLGYKAKKKLLSGSYLKTPYDVSVSPFKLKLEAKRTLKDFIGMEGKWLNKVGPLLSLVFAVGSFAGKQAVEMFSVSLVPNSAIPEMVDRYPVVVVKSVKRIKKEQLITTFVIEYGGRKFFVEPFENYLKREFSLNVDN